MGLLNPYNLLWAASLAILIAIYLRSRSRPTLEVSSLLLFDEAPAPAVRMKHLRIDLLFWLEIATVSAVVLALAGLYVRTKASPGQVRSHALVFDVAAAMGAGDGDGDVTRLDLAKREALKVIDSAPVSDQFSVISYALEARMVHPETADRSTIRDAIASLRPLAVAASRAALASALMRAGTLGEVELFSDRQPPNEALRAAGPELRLNFHRAGSPADNLAIVSLDPGTPGQSRGRVVIRNFSAHPHPCNLAIEQAGQQVYRQPLMFAPHEQMVVPFGPLLAGGTIEARLLTPDALAADNERFAQAPEKTAAQVLVLSPNRSVRDDLARVLLAVNNGFIVAADTPAHFKNNGERYALAVVHDSYVPGINADATLFVYPPASAGAIGALGEIRITGTVTGAQMTARENGETNSAPAVLDSSRIAEIPEWMNVRALGAIPGTRERLPLAAAGAVASGRIGLIAFDIKDHMLLDPDRLDALVATVELIRELTGPAGLQIVSTGTFLSVPASGNATIAQPDGSVVSAPADQWGRVRVQPLWAGHYRVTSGSRTTEVYANYYDASESDLTSVASASAPAPANPAPAPPAFATSPRQVQPLTLILIVIALAALLAESAMLLGRASRWGVSHV